MLKFDNAWRFDSPGPLPIESKDALWALITKIIAQRGEQAITEQFKLFFGAAAGETVHRSSDRGWAMSDLRSHFDSAAENAPLCLEAFYDSLLGIPNRFPDLAMPDLDHVNMILARTDSGFQIVPPNLVSTRAYPSVQVVAVPATLEKQARDLIEKSLTQSQTFLDNGQYKQSVLEIMWLLESIITAFRGVEIDESTVQGKYFNVIAKELRASLSGSTLDRALGWLAELHGYLSSPTGGGLRHGMDLNKGRSIGASEARLYCNLMRSYISFLLDEHERLASPA